MSTRTDVRDVQGLQDVLDLSGPGGGTTMETLTDEQYTMLFTVRSAVRHFLRWSEQEATENGLTPQQHQLLLAIRAHRGPVPPSIGEVAHDLMIRSNTAVGLLARVETMGLVRRRPDAVDQRVVRLALTPPGTTLLEALSRSHLAELRRVGARLQVSEQLLQALSDEFIATVTRAAVPTVTTGPI